MNEIETTRQRRDELPEQGRRDFLSKCAGTLAGITFVGFVAPVLQSCSDDEGNPADPGNGSGTEIVVSVAGLTSDGDAVKTTTNGPDGVPILIIRNSQTSYTAISTKCTHQGCEVNIPQNGVINCLCHGSTYNLSGEVTGGPAQANLTAYQTSYNETTEMLTITAG